MNKSAKLALLALISSILAQPAYAEQSTSESRGVSLTIYNQNFGLVKDVRTIELKQGLNDVRFEDVAAQIDPTSVSFQSLTAPNSVLVREQNYQYDVLNPNTILSKSIGKQAKFRQFLGNGQINDITGTLLNAPQVTVADPNGGSSVNAQGLVIKTVDSIILNPQGQIELSGLPAGLVSKPSLLWKIETTKPGNHETEIAYQTQGLNWHCDYIAVANEDDTKVDLTSWVTLNNSSGASYKNTALKLVAGQPHLVPRQAPRALYSMGAAMDMAAKENFTEQSFAEYHLYKLNGNTDVNQNETKQVSLFNAADIQATKTLVTESQPIFWQVPNQDDKQPVQVKLEIKNSKTNNLGMPLPQGKMRVYKKDQDGALQFVGEDTVNHTPKDETIRLQLGNAFDVVCEHKQTNFLQVSDHITRLSWEIALRNHKDKPVTVSVVEHAQGQWKILNSSQPFEKKDARTFEFKVTVPAHGETKVSYQIEIKN